MEIQKAVDEAHGRVRELKDTYGRPTAQPWSPEQHAGDESKPRYDVEAAVRTKARHPEPEPAEDVAA
ncbi:hypothetical protein [Streptomyces diastatochromogenes]|uniref:hypothetical protein n=1 Tax=Streptomyces diastatochromogenes TaxID=42236 RepID=UPI001FC9236B|nr:hypothetical protein [Streptomyces diastatochromogenes]MCZ0984529.1 hypothetical protein [Streptomyces diastatochromogenes]